MRCRKLLLTILVEWESQIGLIFQNCLQPGLAAKAVFVKYCPDFFSSELLSHARLPNRVDVPYLTPSLSILILKGLIWLSEWFFLSQKKLEQNALSFKTNFRASYIMKSVLYKMSLICTVVAPNDQICPPISLYFLKDKVSTKKLRKWEKLCEKTLYTKFTRWPVCSFVTSRKVLHKN